MGIFVGVCIGLVLFIVIAVWLLFRIVLRRSDGVPWLIRALFKMSQNKNSEFQMSGETLKHDAVWFSDSCEDVWITSEDGLRLHGLYLKNDSGTGRYVIHCHGFRGEASQMSEGTYLGMGWLERRDIARWVDDLAAKNPTAKIVLHGISMGGATVMMAAGEDLRGHVVAAVEDCGYTSVWDMIAAQAKVLHVPTFPVLNLTNFIAKNVAGYTLKEASSVNQLVHCKIPMLFIHGEDDAFVPVAMLDEVYAAAECEKRRLKVPGASHALSAQVAPEPYWGVVGEFLSARDM